MKALNLAQRPFRNERLAATAFGAAAAVLIALTLWHAIVIRDLLPARTSERHREVAALEAEATKLDTEARTLKTEPPPPARASTPGERRRALTGPFRRTVRARSAADGDRRPERGRSRRHAVAGCATLGITTQRPASAHRRN